ncbi:MAG TPA: CbtA family protein [Sphingobium sp.]
MTRSLLIRGMIAGIIAAVLVTLFARTFAEPSIDLAIGFEAAHEQASHAAMPGMAAPDEPELVSRATQKGLGLLTAITLYGAAVGGIFSLVFAAAYGRAGMIGPRTLSLLLAIGAFVAVTLIPALKYPPTPPAVGLHETVGFRTATFFAMIGLSLSALVMAIALGRGVAARFGAFNGGISAALIYIVTVFAVQAVLPDINEVPPDFPATVLWDFRIASIAMQALLWSVIGVGFGMMAERVLRR